MPTTVITVDDIVNIDETYPDDDAKAYRRMKELTGGAPEGILARLLWQAFADERIELGRYQDAWYTLAKSPESCDGELFVKFVEDVAYHENNTSGRRSRTSVGLKGWLPGYRSIVRAKKEDPEFSKFLANRWRDLPEPFDAPLGLYLANCEVIDTDELPENLIDEMAAQLLSRKPRRWPDELLPWKDDELNEALLTAALCDDTSTIVFEVFELLADMATLDESITLLKKISYPRNDFEPLRELVRNDAELLPALEAELASHDDFESKSQAGFFLVVTYCLCCQEAGEVPSPELDEQIARFIRAYEPPNLKIGEVEPFHEKLRAILSVIPTERLGRIFVQTKDIRWYLVGAAPTEEVCRQVARKLGGMRSDPYRFAEKRDVALQSLGKAAVPALCEALEDGAHCHAEEMVLALGAAGDDRAASTLVDLLIGDNKDLREAAKKSLLDLSPSAVVDHLPRALKASRKAKRMAGAELLHALPASRRAYELAQEYLETEKTADVQAILEAVRAPIETKQKTESSGLGDLESRLDDMLGLSSNGGQHPSPTDSPPLSDNATADPEEILSELVETDGRCWKRYIDVGEALIGIYVKFLGRRYYGKLAELKESQLRALRGILENFPDSDSAHREMVDLLGATWPDSGWKLADLADEVLSDFPAELYDAFVEDRLHRPAVFGSGADQRAPFGALEALRWLTQKQTEYAWETALKGLAHDNNNVRSESFDLVCRVPDKLDVEAHIAPLLEASTMDRRQIGVKLFGEVAETKHLPVLEEALENERSKKVADLIEKTMAHVSTRDLEFAEFADDEEGNAALDKRLARLSTRPVDAGVEESFGELPSPRFEEGGSLSDGALRWFLGEVMSEDADHVSHRARKLRERLVDEDCHALCDELIELHGSDDDGWALYMQAILAGPEQIDSLGRRLEKFASSASYSWGDHAVEVLVRVGTDQCVRILDDWANRTRKKALKKRANEGLRRIADARGVNTVKLIESTLGTFGFDASGARTFDYGARQITVRLTSGGDFSYENQEGRRFKNMPRARKVDDDELANNARRTVSRLKKDIKRVRRSQTKRLHRAMTSRRRWNAADWRELYADHPVMRSFAYGLVWGLYDDHGELITAFQLDDDGQPVNLDFEVPDIDECHRIGIVHPLELGDSREDWLEALADYERVQPFEQLERPVYEKGHIRDPKTHFDGLPPVPAPTFLGRLNRLGYELGPREDAGLIVRSERNLGGPKITIKHDGIAPQYLDNANDVGISNITVFAGGRKVSPADAPPLVYSEMLHDMYFLMDST